MSLPTVLPRSASNLNPSTKPMSVPLNSISRQSKVEVTRNKTLKHACAVADALAMISL
ncbi:MAG: hypothetical protein KZQ80_11125 [Candidatus Thiodiazotropha sp. (ex Monitilora ramsayi)]|nr:hypothetical protein [Candidatus Thiodiazotropha sp. (ex Monitilora ramsayi)]